MPAPIKYPTSFRLSGVALAILASLADQEQVGRGAIIEIALRDLARKRGIDVRALDRTLRAEEAARWPASRAHTEENHT